MENVTRFLNILSREMNIPEIKRLFLCLRAIIAVTHYIAHCVTLEKMTYIVLRDKSGKSKAIDSLH